MVRRVTPAQLQSMIRQAEQKQRQAIQEANRAINNYNREVRRVVDNYNREVRGTYRTLTAQAGLSATGYENWLRSYYASAFLAD